MKVRFILLHAIFGVYLYALVTIILFKGNAVDLSYLADQLQTTLQDPYIITHRMERGNVVPFYEIKRAMEAGTNHGYLNVYGNIAIFMPFGLLIGMLGKGKMSTLAWVAIGALGLSLLLECMQAVFAIGAFDVDDILLNTCGGVLGWWSCRLPARIQHLFRSAGAVKAESITPPGQI